MLPVDLAQLLDKLRIIGTEQQHVEVKSGAGKNMLETLSAFSNKDGGIIIFGIDEESGFTPVPNFDSRKTQDSLNSFCEKLTPPVRPTVEVMPFEGSSVVVAHFKEMAPFDKPCYITARGPYGGSYIRLGESEHRLTAYEVDRLREESHQPRWDRTPVEEARLTDLDENILRSYLQQQRNSRPKTFKDGEDIALRRLQVLQGDSPTFAALLAMGDFPQEFYPRLTVTFALYPGAEKGEVGEGIRLLDSARLRGPIPELVDEGVRLVEKNMRTAGLIEGVFRRDLPDYPQIAVREALVNALMHRDYSPTALGTPVQIDMFMDRLVISNPGGLYGGVTKENLGTPGASSTRNQQLATFLEDLHFDDGGLVAENRGTGIATMTRATADALMPPPVFSNSLTHFSVTFHKRKVAAEETHETAYQQVLRLFDEQHSWSSTELRNATGRSRSAIQLALNQLMEEGRVERTEPSRSPKQRYRLTK